MIFNWCLSEGSVTIFISSFNGNIPLCSFLQVNNCAVLLWDLRENSNVKLLRSQWFRSHWGISKAPSREGVSCDHKSNLVHTLGCTSGVFHWWHRQMKDKNQQQQCWMTFPWLHNLNIMMFKIRVVYKTNYAGSLSSFFFMYCRNIEPA